MPFAFGGLFFLVVLLPRGLHGRGLGNIKESSRLASKPGKDFVWSLEAGMSEAWRWDLRLTSYPARLRIAIKSGLALLPTPVLTFAQLFSSKKSPK